MGKRVFVNTRIQWGRFTAGDVQKNSLVMRRSSPYSPTRIPPRASNDARHASPSSSHGFSSRARVQHPICGAGTIVAANTNDPSRTVYKVRHDTLHYTTHAMGWLPLCRIKVKFDNGKVELHNEEALSRVGPSAGQAAKPKRRSNQSKRSTRPKLLSPSCATVAQPPPRRGRPSKGAPPRGLRSKSTPPPSRPTNETSPRSSPRSIARAVSNETDLCYARLGLPVPAARWVGAAARSHDCHEDAASRRERNAPSLAISPSSPQPSTDAERAPFFFPTSGTANADLNVHNDACGREGCYSPIHPKPATCSEGKKKRTHALAALALACGEEDSEVFQDGFKTPNASFEGAPWGIESS